MLTGATDMAQLRGKGVPSYGIGPVVGMRALDAAMQAAGSLGIGIALATVLGFTVGIATIIAVSLSGYYELNLGDSEVLGLFLAVIACGYAAANSHLSPADR